ncbi:hypothetical protein EVA_08174 [gut metagenome]|uniref:Uncharacterized protein n=1 Tax=gut metagenome TaxID=749906 RepID=J9GTN0_9ZZZZ
MSKRKSLSFGESRYHTRVYRKLSNICPRRRPAGSQPIGNRQKFLWSPAAPLPFIPSLTEKSRMPSIGPLPFSVTFSLP